MRAVALLALAACGGSSKPAAQAPKTRAEQVDETKAEKGAKDLVEEIYEDISHGDTDSLQPTINAQVMVFGPRRADVFGSRADALVALKTVVDPKAKKKPQLHSTALSVVPSPGGRSAWTADVIDVEGESLAVAAILSNADDIWLVDVAALAHTPAMKTVRAQLKQDAVVPPAMTGIAKVDGSAQGAVDKFNKGLASQQLWGDDLASRSDAVVIGPGAGDVTRGKTEIKKLWKHRMKDNVREVIAGDTTAAATKDGQLAWVTAPVVRFQDDEEPLPVRAFAGFEKSGSEWKMIALTESVALDVAGAGAPFKKTQPPKLEKKEEPPPPKKTDDSKTKKTTKKKKKPKKPPPKDDDDN